MSPTSASISSTSSTRGTGFSAHQRESRPRKAIWGPIRSRNVRPNAIRIVVADLRCTLGDAAHDGTYAFRYVVAGHLGRFDIHVHAAEGACSTAVEVVAQRDQRGRLARLARRMQHEVLLVLNETEEVAEFHPIQGRDRVVLIRAYGAGGAEEAHRVAMVAQIVDLQVPDDGAPVVRVHGSFSSLSPSSSGKSPSSRRRSAIACSSYRHTTPSRVRTCATKPTTVSNSRTSCKLASQSSSCSPPAWPHLRQDHFLVNFEILGFCFRQAP